VASNKFFQEGVHGEVAFFGNALYEDAVIQLVVVVVGLADVKEAIDAQAKRLMNLEV
jgi:hypothetical protein